MICPNCKAKLNDTAVFCVSCGVNIAEFATQAAMTTQVSPDQTAATPTKKLGRLGFFYKKPTKKCRNFNIATFAILVVCIALIIISHVNIIVGDITETFALQAATSVAADLGVGGSSDVDINKYLDELDDIIDEAEDKLAENKSKIKSSAYKDAEELLEQAKALSKKPSIEQLNTTLDACEVYFDKYKSDIRKTEEYVDFDIKNIANEAESLTKVTKILTVSVICHIVLLCVIFLLSAIFKNTALAILGTILSVFSGTLLFNPIFGILILIACTTYIVFTILINKEYKAYKKSF